MFVRCATARVRMRFSVSGVPFMFESVTDLTQALYSRIRVGIR